MKTKTFDCVEMKQRGAERVVREVEGMTVERQLEYWHRFTEELCERKRRHATLAAGKDITQRA